MIISKTPYRISFFGGGTDYPEWYLKSGGEVLSSTINKYLYLSCRHLPEFFSHRFRIVYSTIELVKKIDEINHPVVKMALKKYYKNKLGLEIHYDGDLPSRSGMGSSSVFVVGLLNILNKYMDNKIGKKKLAMQSIFFEQKLLKEVVGSQDQVAASYGGFNSIKFYQNGSFKVSNLLTSKKAQNVFFNNMYLVFTGISRYSHGVANSYVKKSNTINKNYLYEILNQVKEAKKLLKNQSFDDFGKLLHETWLVKKKLSNIVSNNQIDELYEVGRSAGALGGKLLGAGGGGFVLFYVKKENHKIFLKAFKKKVVIPIKLSNEGSEIIFNNEKK